jgi:hypothetical protein
LNPETVRAWRRGRTFLLVLVTLAALAYAWWAGQGELIATQRVTARVERIKPTADGDGPLLLQAVLADGRTVWVIVPRDAPRPHPGDEVALVRERYADGTVRYRFNENARDSGVMGGGGSGR